MTLSKKELENRIAGGGQVFDRQADYMEYVNRQIFGFETVEEYKELIDLLIQLRTPKLSKDFKPSVVNDILSDSLQPLSDEDLRPMSEAIENMDTMNLNLKAREAGYQAAEKIQRVLDRYNRLTLFEKADRCCENQKKLSEAEREAKAQADEMERSRERVLALEQEISELDARRDAMENERESLSKSDAVSLKSRELDLAARIRTRESLLEEKQRQLDAKQEQYTEIEGKKKQEEDRAYEKERELDSILEEMQSEAGEMSFEEHDFFQDELKENFNAPFSWDIHEAQFRKVKDEISRGTELLREAETRQREADDLLKKRERQQRETDAAQRREGELESVLVQVENEWKEALYSWNGQNEELKFTPEQMRKWRGLPTSTGRSQTLPGCVRLRRICGSGEKVRSAEKSAADRMNSGIWKMSARRSRRSLPSGRAPVNRSRPGAMPCVRTGKDCGRKGFPIRSSTRSWSSGGNCPGIPNGAAGWRKPSWRWESWTRL